MSKSCQINFADSTIDVTAAFMKKASIYGTPEYTELLNAQNDRPEFKINIITSSKKSGSKSVTYDEMKEYVRDEFGENSNQEKALLHTLKRAKKENIGYGAVKNWFFRSFPNYGILKDLNEQSSISNVIPLTP